MGSTDRRPAALAPASALFAKARRNVLGILFLRPESEFHLRQIIREAGVGAGAVQRELARLVAGGLALRSNRGNQVLFRANRESPVFGEIKALMVKTAGVADVLRDALSGLAERIRAAFVYGSFASGAEGPESDVDLLVVGRATFGEVAEAVRAAERILGREINPTVYPEREFARKKAARHPFLMRVLEGPRIPLLGSENDIR